jgi:hypothetical protein
MSATLTAAIMGVAQVNVRFTSIRNLQMLIFSLHVFIVIRPGFGVWRDRVTVLLQHDDTFVRDILVFGLRRQQQQLCHSTGLQRILRRGRCASSGPIVF